MSAPDLFPDGMTDPDERDRWLEAQDERDVRHLYVVPPAGAAGQVGAQAKAEIAARMAYDRKPLWERLRLTLRGERPAGLVDRHPTGPFGG